MTHPQTQMSVDFIRTASRDQLEAYARYLESENASNRRTIRDLLGKTEKDGLTGLCNKGYLIRQIEQAAAPRDRRLDIGTHALFLIDLDGFKQINDTISHQAGDDALKIVANALRDVASRDSDVVARIGGDEFAILLYGIDEETAQDKRMELYAKFETLALVHGERTIPLRGSVGLSMIDTTLDHEGNLNLADQAMYAEKNRRRAEGLAPVR